MYTYNDALELILSTQGNWLFVGPEVYQDFTKFEFTEGFLFLRDLLDAQIREAQLDGVVLVGRWHTGMYQKHRRFPT